MEELKFNFRNTTVKVLLALAVVIFIISLFAPYFLTRPHIGNLDFSSTGQIGDTIGGIMNPFISGVGILVTFLAFYMQLKANESQILLFNQGIANEARKKKDEKEQIELESLSILIFDLEEAIKDLEKRFRGFEDYEKQIATNLLKTNFLKREVLLKIERLTKTPRSNVYFFLRRKLGAEMKDFSKLYQIIDFLPQYLSDTYSRCDKLINDHFQIKNKVRQSLNELRIRSAKYHNELAAAQEESQRDKLLIAVLNHYINRFDGEIKQTYDENRRPVRESNLSFLKVELENMLNGLEGVESSDYEDDYELMELIRIGSEILQSLYYVENEVINFAQHLREDLLVKLHPTNDDSILKTLKDIYAQFVILQDK